MSLRVSHHLLLCATSTTSSCCDCLVGAATWKCLKRLVRDLGLENRERSRGIVLRTKVDCLRVCEDGPILLIWPDGTWYGKVDESRIEVIIKQHVIGGIPIEDWIIKRTPLVIC